MHYKLTLKSMENNIVNVYSCLTSKTTNYLKLFVTLGLSAARVLPFQFGISLHIE